MQRKIVYSKGFSRRNLILKLSKLGLAMPLLPSLGGATIKNLASSSLPRRFIAIFTANGQMARHWYPDKNIPLRQINSYTRGIRLTEIDSEISSA